jgi:hypothetical protein
MQQAWREVRDEACSPRTLSGLPSYVDNLASAMWNVEPSHMIQAVMNRDPAFFVAVIIRIELIHQIAKEHGKTVVERAALLRAKHVAVGFQIMAEKLLREAGATWPPGPPAEAAPSENIPSGETAEKVQPPRTDL